HPDVRRTRARLRRAHTRARKAQRPPGRRPRGRGAVATVKKNSASRWRFRPPRPTGLPPRGCPLVVEPLGRGFDLVALRARCRGEATARAEGAQDELSGFCRYLRRPATHT